MSHPPVLPAQDLAAPAKSGLVAAPLLDGEFRPDIDPELAPIRKTMLGRPQHLLELACKVVQAPWGGVGLLSEDGELVEHFAYGVSEELAADLLRSTWTLDLLRYALAQPGSTFLPDLTDEAEQLGTPPGLSPIGPFLALPLQFPGRCRGALYLGRARGAPPFGPADEEMVQPICTWLENGKLFEEAHFQAQMQLLNRVAQAAAGNLDLARILSAALRELDRHLPLHVCAVWLAEGEDAAGTQPDASPVDALPAPVFLRLAEVSSVSRERTRALGLVPGLRLLLEQTPFTDCVQKGQALYADWNSRHGDPTSGMPVSVADRAAADRLRPGRSRGAACLAVPLRAGDRIVGVLQSLLTRPAGFTRDQIQLLSLVADLLGPAVSSSQLYGQLRNAYEELRLTQGQLIQAEKMRALGELASGMAHEFNNSLCGVLGFLELTLLERGLDSTSRSYLESARTCALDATQTVRRVQDFARNQRDVQNLQRLDANELVRQTLELARHKWEDLTHVRGTPIEVEMQTEASGKVAGCPTELREVLTNLIFNAVDAMPAGGTLGVRTWSTASDVFLAVSDTGVGISPAVRQRLFEPFFTTKGERGNGLGLSVVFGIVRRHQGEITVESQPGQGSTFTVRLPLVAENLEPDDSLAEEQSGASPTVGMRVLVIEDDDKVRDFLNKGLTLLGHRPCLTAEGQEGLAALDAERFDVVLTDLGLPGISGEELARRISLRPSPPPVIVLTGWADQIRSENWRMAGVTSVLGKPVALDALADALAAVCPPLA